MRKPVLAVAFLFLLGVAEAFSQTPMISLSPAAFSFSAFQSGALPLSQTLQLTNAGGGTLNWSVSKKNNSNWLSAGPANGTAPSSVTVAITRTNLPPGTYLDTLVVVSGGAANSPQKVSVTYVVSAPPQPAVISLSPTLFNFNAFQNGSLPLSQTLQLTNAGGGTLNWSVSKKHNSSWLSAGPANGTAPSSVTVSITTTGLVPNTYVDTLVVSAAGASNSPQQVPVVYTVSVPPQPAVISLSPTSFNYSAYQSGSLPLSQNLEITNAGGGTLNWSISKKHNSSWLSAGPANGTAPSTVIVSITTTGLVPNTYVDTLLISSGEASNSPQQVPVVYVVSLPPQPAVISATPASFDFNAIQSGPVPFAQQLQIENAGGGTLNWSIAKAHNSAWLSATPGNATAPSTVNVAITTTGLVPNTYVDTLVITSGDAGNSPVRVPIAYTVTPPITATISFSPLSFSFSAAQNGPLPSSQTLQISNSGSGTLNWTISSNLGEPFIDTDGDGTYDPTVDNFITCNCPENQDLNFNSMYDGDGVIYASDWLAPTPVSGTAPSSITVAITRTDLPPGTYPGKLTIAGNATNSPQEVPVHLHLDGPVLSPASLQISQTSLDFEAQKNQPIPPQFIEISNGGQLPLNWTAAILLGASWLSINPPSGTDAGILTVSVTTDLNPLTYEDTIIIEAAGALNSPRKIPVRLNITTDVGDEPGNRPRAFTLFQNYPNPFNPTTKIDFALPRSGRATLEVFNVVGQRIRVLVDGELPAGTHSVVWDGRESSGQMVGSGIYFYRLKSQNFSDIKRAVFLK